MRGQEFHIVRLPLNEMARKRAMTHFHESLPNIAIELFHKLEHIGIPLKSDGNIEDYRGTDTEFDETHCVFDNCHRYLRT